MARVRENWSRLVNATGLAAAVPPSRTRTTNIETILEVADEIQDQNPDVARILSEQAYEMALNIAPSTEGRGVLQFKTGLTSVIKQKLCKKGRSQIDRSNDIERMWEYYQLYKQKHRVEDIQREEEKWQQSGVFRTNWTELTDMREVFATLRALIMVMECLSTNAAPGTRISIMVMDELKRIKLTEEIPPFVIASLDAPPLTNAIGVFPEGMARVRDNWGRLVKAAHQASGLAVAVPPSRITTTNIEAILQAADEIQDQDPNVARILCEQAYEMARNIDPSSEGRGVLQFKTGLTSVIKQKLCKKGGSKIDRSNDIERMWEYYQLYKQKHRVEDIQREEEKWQQSGVFSTNLTELTDMREVFATLRALIVVMECLNTNASPGTRISIMVMEEIKRFRFTGGLTPFDMAPLDSPPFTNAIGVFPEVIPSLVSTSDHIHATTLRDPTSHSDWNAPNPPHSNASSSGWALSESSTSHPQSATVLPSAPPLPYSDWPIYYPSIDATPLEVSMRNEAPNPTESKDKDENMCVICWDSPVEGACIPCGHMAGCMSCLNQIKFSKRDCPVCRAEISQVVRIYAV